MFRDPVHGLIEFKGDDAPLQAILETRAVQRLRRIKQMGFAWLVYPGAEHSRFGHALGAYHIAQRIVAELGLDERTGRHVKVAALLHDVGHGPFSHAWEEAFGHTSHERWGQRLVAEDPELAATLDALEPGLPATLVTFWDKTYQPTFARKLVSSQLDVDRLDYLLRDGHYSGAGYATYDLDWIVYALRIEAVRGDHPDPQDLVVDYRRGMYAVEQYLFARSYMYAQVYHHKTVRAAEWMFLKLLSRYVELVRASEHVPTGLAPAEALARGEDIPVSQYLWLDDVSVIGAMDRWAGRGLGEPAVDGIVRDLATRLAERRLFKTIELGDDPAVVDEIEPLALAAAQAEFGSVAPYYFAIDNARQVGYLANDKAEELFVVGHPQHGVVSLGKLLADLPLGKPSSTIRLVCAPELLGALRPIVARVLG